MSNYPLGIDDSTTLPNPTDNSLTSSPNHATLHSTENDAIKALEAKLGTGASTATSGTLLRGTGTGTTTFAQANLATDVTGTLPVGNGGTGATTSTGTNNVVLSDSPTIVTPTIASFVNANHNHQNGADGGTLAESALVLTDVTTGNVSTSAHGFVPKAPNDANLFLRGDASYAASRYFIACGMFAFGPTDATTYYPIFGINYSNSEADSRIYIPHTTTLTGVYLNVSTGGTVGTTETSTISVRKNNTTDTTITSSLVASTGTTTYNNSALSIAFAAGDFMAIKWVTPTWATNPGQVSIQVTIRFN